jgi:hypothetical protein
MKCIKEMYVFYQNNFEKSGKYFHDSSLQQLGS